MSNKILTQFIAVLCLFSLTQSGYSQKDTKFGFGYPLNPPLILSGNFGELRSNHFHSGLDIKTKGQEGASVMAIADGYIDRINISHGGFGKALYIRHSNGLTSVYGHLQKFNAEIEAYVKAKQYKNQTYVIEIFPGVNELKVNKGDLVALSGNSGGSYGPHLHFEVRNTITQHPLNPLLYGFDVRDDESPVVSKIWFVPYDKNSGKFETEKSVQVNINSKVQKSILKDTLKVSDSFSVQFLGYDLSSDSRNKLGIYSIAIYKDNLKMFETEFKEFSFDESRYINACIDYATKKVKNQTFTRCYLLPNNKFSVYNKNGSDGIIILKDSLVHQIKIMVKDFYGNSKEIIATVKKEKINNKIELSSEKYSKLLIWDKTNRFICEGLELNFEQGSFYDNVEFQFKENIKTKNTYTPIYSIHKTSEPVHKFFKIKIKIPDSLDTSKLLIASIDNNKYYYEGGTVENQFINARIRSFGNYTVIADTVKPVLDFISLPQKNKSSLIKVKLYDDLSGVKSYKTLINNKWLLMEYDKKNNKLTGDISDLKLEGKLKIECWAEDERQNNTYISKTIEW